MQILWGSLEHQVLELLFEFPAPVRGMSEVMIDRAAPGAGRMLDEMAEAGLVASRGWCEGPGAIWVPTEEGATALAAVSNGDAALLP